MSRWFYAAAAAVLAVGTAAADDNRFVPIDTNKLVVRPSRAVSQLTASTINMVGSTAASQVQNHGVVRTFNNLFGYSRPTISATQPGSGLPNPILYPSTRYVNYNTPVMPTSMPAR